jgi:small subunit ribosomal protein S2
VIPGNDDAIRSINLYASGIADAVLDARSAITVAVAGSQDDFVELDTSAEKIAPTVKADVPSATEEASRAAVAALDESSPAQ